VVTLRTAARGAILLATTLACAVGLSGCGSTGLTAARLQSSIAPTFARLYVLQQVDQGNPRPSLTKLHPRGHCQKGTPDSTQQGAGDDWVCHITFLVAGPATPVVATYTVNLQTNGCYAADGDGPTALNGSRTITGAGYEQVPNPLWLINGCFDVG
jgi:ABC-2 type transport system permease protein